MSAEALQFIMGLLGRERPRLAADARLWRMRRLLERLGRPERGLPLVLVAGTKGKGSTAAMLDAIERAAGRRTGLYTKPHFVEYRERIRVDGAMITPEDLAALVAEARPHVEAAAGDPEGLPTYFEVSVALALLAFRRREVELAIVEVGVGGRLDATNAADPVLSVITPISFDHTETLGPTLAAIAREKGGIIRSGRPVVVAPQPLAAQTALFAVAAERGAVWLPVAERARWEIEAMSPHGQRVRLAAAADYGSLVLPLVGRHQASNAATAVVAAETLASSVDSSVASAGYPLPAEAVRGGLATLRWPGRVEVLSERPTIIVDVAHNVASMQALREALLELWPGRRMVLVFAMVATHDHEGPAAVIAPVADVAIVTEPDHLHPLPAARLADAVRPYVAQVEIVPERGAAVHRALALARPGDVICITGSFYLAGAARAAIADAQEADAAGANLSLSPGPTR
ncbi:MAG: bifunctional folylpolyglutamate synthase/dihydrofolate synthase [bacterium]